MSELSDNINHLAYQIDNSIDCEVLSTIVKQHLDGVLGLIQNSIETQYDLLGAFQPLLKLPSANPSKIVSYLKKLVIKTIIPQIQAAIKIALDVIELASALTDLISSITNAGIKLAKCVTQITVDSLLTITTFISDTISDALNRAFTQIDSLQASLSETIGFPLDAIIDTSSIDNFKNTALSSFDQINNQVNSFAEEELGSIDVFEGNITIPGGGTITMSGGGVNIVEQPTALHDETITLPGGGSISMVKGAVANVTAAAEGFTGNVEVSNTVTFEVTGGIITGVANTA